MKFLTWVGYFIFGLIVVIVANLLYSLGMSKGYDLVAARWLERKTNKSEEK